MKSIAPQALIGLGMLLLVGSFAWPMFQSPTGSWTDEKSLQMRELADEALVHKNQLEMAQRNPSMTSGENPAVIKEKHDAVMAELNQMRDEFKSATESPQGTGTLLKWSGIAVVGVGVVAWMAFKNG